LRSRLRLPHLLFGSAESGAPNLVFGIWLAGWAPVIALPVAGNIPKHMLTHGTFQHLK